MPIKDYSTNPNNNNASPPHGAPEGMKPSDVNNVMRQIMADIRSYCEAGGWFNWNHVPTYIANDKLTIPGDVRSIYVTGRMLKISLSGQDVFTAVKESKISGNNTEITLQDKVINNTIAEIYLGLEPEVLNNVAGVGNLCIATATNNGNEIALTPLSGVLASPTHKGTELAFYADSNNTGAVKLMGKDLKYTSSDKLVDLKANYIEDGKYYKARYNGTEWVITEGLVSSTANQGKSIRTTITPGKFFTRTASGSLPSGIDSTKVWSLDDQKSSLRQPAGKDQIELPIGAVVTFKDVAGGPSSSVRILRQWSYQNQGIHNVQDYSTSPSERGTKGTLKTKDGTDLLLGSNVLTANDGIDAPDSSAGVVVPKDSITRTVSITTVESTIWDYTTGKKADAKTTRQRFTRSWSTGSATSQTFATTNAAGTEDGYFLVSY